MLTKESSRGFICQDYPNYEYLSKSGNRRRANCDGSRIIPAPKGYTEVIRFHDEDEAFADYIRWNMESLADVPDERFKEHPYGIFIGNGRNARWYDEAQRRGLV